jgi:hypothetical protein
VQTERYPEDHTSMHAIDHCSIHDCLENIAQREGNNQLGRGSTFFDS